MNSKRLSELKAKWSVQRHDIDIAEVAEDVHEILNAIPEGPSHAMYRNRYLDKKVSVTMMHWIAQQDVDALLAQVISSEIVEEDKAADLVDEIRNARDELNSSE